MTHNPELLDPTPQAMTLLQYVTAMGNAIRRDPALQGAWVTAELSDVRIAGGHCYMELIEKSESGQTTAKLRAMIWQSSLGRIRHTFLSATGRELGSGMKVMVYGTASHHPVYGLAFTISAIDPSYTLGDMERIRREILTRLTRENVVDLNKKLQLTPAPQRIAVISAAGAAGYGDFINQLESSAEGFVFYTALFPAVMQGENCATSVADALERVEMTIDLWDLVVIIRGGGATTDLNGFDNYELARRVATFPLPVAVGIGHERDRTVLDEIAHTRCKTPTAVASWLIDYLRQSHTRLMSMADFCARYASERTSGENMRLANIAALIPAAAGDALTSARMRLSAIASTIPATAAGRIARENGRLSTVRSLLNAITTTQTSRCSRQLDDISRRVEECAGRTIESGFRRIESLEALVKALDPVNTLRRGYSVTRVNGHAITSVNGITPGTILQTTLADGTIDSTAG